MRKIKWLTPLGLDKIKYVNDYLVKQWDYEFEKGGKLLQNLVNNRLETEKRIQELIEKNPPYTKEELRNMSKEDIEIVSKILTFNPLHESKNEKD